MSNIFLLAVKLLYAPQLRDCGVFPYGSPLNSGCGFTLRTVQWRVTPAKIFLSFLYLLFPVVLGIFFINRKISRSLVKS